MTRSKLILILAILAGLWSAASSSEQSYRLGPEDVVGVTVFGHPELSTVAQIRGDGRITFPTIGEVSIGGLTTREAEVKLQNALTSQNIIALPQVAIAVQNYASHQVAVLGQVANPGTFALTRGDTTIMDMISEAGGLTDEAGDVAIVTRKSDGNARGTIVDLTSILEGRTSVAEPKVSDGDRIFVPRMERFYIYGQVNKPGVYRLDRGMTVMQAISVAGGLTDKGTERGITLRRTTTRGVETISTSMTQPLQNNDVVYVKESLF